MVININFMRNLTTEKVISESDLSSLTELSDEQKNSIRKILKKALEKGQNPKKASLEIVGRIDHITKKRIGGVIDIDKFQNENILQIKKLLENLDSAYLLIECRDKRYDKSVKKAIQKQEKLSTEQIDRILLSLKNKLIMNFINTIIQGEYTKARNKGEYENIKKIIKEGLIDENQIIKWWDDCGDNRTRKSHAYMGKVYSKEKGIPFSEPFILPSGEKMMYPGDDSMGAPVSEIDGCRCVARYNIDFLKPYIE